MGQIPIGIVHDQQTAGCNMIHDGQRAPIPVQPVYQSIVESARPCGVPESDVTMAFRVGRTVLIRSDEMVGDIPASRFNESLADQSVPLRRVLNAPQPFGPGGEPRRAAAGTEFHANIRRMEQPFQNLDCLLGQPRLVRMGDFADDRAQPVPDVPGGQVNDRAPSQALVERQGGHANCYTGG